MKGRGTYLLIGRILSFAMAILILVVSTTDLCRAEIAGDGAFKKITWQEAFTVSSDKGGLQGFCVTDDRIIFIQNTSSVSQEPDKVYAYYLNDTDRYGNPVEQYSLADMRDDEDWEHGNSLTYNPSTNLIYVAFATSLEPDNKGCIGVMDPETLGMVDVIRLTEDFRILGISYIAVRDIYLVQAEVEGGFRFLFYDADFNLLQDMGEAKSSDPGYTYQGLCVTEDYVLIPPALGNGTVDSYINVFSLKDSTESPLVVGVNDLGLEDYQRVEAEAIAEIGPGRYMMNVYAVNAEGEKEFRFYTAEIPYFYHVRVISNEDGAESGSYQALRGGSFSVPYADGKDFLLEGISVDGIEMNVEDYSEGYTFENVQSDHMIEIVFRNRYPAAVNTGASSDTGTVAVPAATVDDVYGEYGRSTFSMAVAAVNEAASDLTMQVIATFVGGFMHGVKFVVLLGKASVNNFTGAVNAVSQGILRHRGIITRTCNTLLLLGGMFGLMVLRVRIIRRRKMAYVRSIRQKLKEEMERVVVEPDLDDD